MKTKEIRRSPLFYVGDKFRLMPSLLPLFPKEISTFIEPFAGGGTVMLNVYADHYIEGDINPFVVGLHRHLIQYAGEGTSFLSNLFDTARHYGLSCSFLKDEIPMTLRQAYPKTYFAKYNKEAYLRLRSDFNRSNPKDFTRLYLLLIYGFNHMIRFNTKGEFNLPVGNVDFNKNVVSSLEGYFEAVKDKDISWHVSDFRDLLTLSNPQVGDFVYLDPPYLITFSEYNKFWSIQEEKALLQTLDKLNDKGVAFGISNVTHYRGRENQTFIEWSRRYKMHEIKSNYISYHDNTQKQSREIFVTNY
ncbi:DNA adenine methylase [Porphyromonas asaccharolytica]